MKSAFRSYMLFMFSISVKAFSERVWSWHQENAGGRRGFGKRS